MDVIVLFDENNLDNVTVVETKTKFYEFQKNMQGNLQKNSSSSGGLNLYLLNSTDEYSSISLCKKSVAVGRFSTSVYFKPILSSKFSLLEVILYVFVLAPYTSVKIVKNLWYFWLLIPVALLVIGLCASRFVIVGDMKKHKSEFQKMVSKLQL